VGDRFGITSAEAELRLQYQHGYGPAKMAVNADHRSFAGLSQTGSDGSFRLNVRYVGENTRRTEIEALVPSNLPAVEWTPVKYSYGELESAASEVAQLLSTKDQSGFWGYAIDVVQNRVVVNVVPGSAVASTAALLPVAPDIFVVEPTEPPSQIGCNDDGDHWNGSRYNCTPLRGGDDIWPFQNGTGDYRCTSTLHAKTPNGNKFMITAGHCGDHLAGPNGTAQPKLWTNYGQDLLVNCNTATTCRNTADGFHNDATISSDSRRFPRSQSSGLNKIYLNNQTHSYAVTSDVYWTNQNVNDVICKSGVGPTPIENDCGEILYYDAVINLFGAQGGPLIPVKVGDVQTLGGDSGAPILSWAPYNELYGLAVVNQINPVRTWWSTPTDIEFDLNVVFCLTDTCSNG